MFQTRSFRFDLFLVILGLIVTTMACESESSTSSSTEGKKEPAAVPSFDRKSAFAFVEKQLSFGPRVPNSEGHQACKAWLVEQFKSFGANVIEQDFEATAYTGVTLNSTNIIAEFNPSANERVLLAAHWDTRHIADSPLSNERQEEPIMGADDGGSGVAVLLEIGRLIQQNPMDIGVDIILFDAEDYGESGGDDSSSWALGSQYWSRNLHKSNYRPKYGILLDMVGSKGARFPKEGFSMRFAPGLVNKVWALANRMGYSDKFVEGDGGFVTDDHFFVNTIARIPMIDIINRSQASETGFGHYWHTHNDDIDIIDDRTLKAVGQVVLATIYRENNGTL